MATAGPSPAASGCTLANTVSSNFAGFVIANRNPGAEKRKLDEVGKQTVPHVTSHDSRSEMVDC